MAKNIQLNQTVVDAVIIIVCRDGFARLVIGRTVHRRDIVNIHITRHNHDAAGMLASRALDACQTAHERSNLRRMHGNALFLVILADIANGCLVRNRGNRTCTAHVVAAKKLLGILMRDALVGHSRRIIGINTAGEVQVDIRNLVAMEAKEDCERNIMAVTQHPRTAFRTFLRRQVEAAVHLIVQEELAVTAMRTAIVRLQRVNLGDVEHRRYEGRADTATRANKIAAVNRVLNELMRNIIQNGEAVADNRVQLHLQAVLDKLRQLIAIPGMCLGIGKVAHRLLRTGDERRIQLVTVRHRLEALHHLANLVRIRNHDLIGRLLAQIGEFLEHFLRRMQIQRRLHISVLIFLAGLQNRTQLCILRIEEMHVAGRHDELAQLFAQLINLAVMRTQILLGTHILTHEEGVVACRLNLQIIIEAGDFLQMRVAHAVAHSAVQLARLARRADNQALAVFLDNRTRQQRTLVEIAQMADAD